MTGTGRPMDCPGSGKKRSEVHSQYYGGPAVKYLVVCTDSTFVLRIPPAVPGPMTDDEIHKTIWLIHEIVNNCPEDIRDGMLHYIYDRGLVHTQLMEMHGIMVHTPDRKANKQTGFSAQSALRSKIIAIVRVHIERINRELRTYSGFDSKTSQAGLDLATAEANTARFFVNLKMRSHNYLDSTHDWSKSSTTTLNVPQACVLPAEVFD